MSASEHLAAVERARLLIYSRAETSEDNTLAESLLSAEDAFVAMAAVLEVERARGQQLACATRALAMGFTDERVRDVVEALKPYSGEPA